MKRIYLDNAATTPVSWKAKWEMLKYMSPAFANPGSIHLEGSKAALALREARERTAKVLHAMPEEIIFTSGATEANNLAINGVIDIWQKENPNKAPHMVVSNFEHHSVLVPIEKLEREGKVEVTYLKPSTEGFVSGKQVREALKENTVLVSVIYANNEIGTIQPIKDISLAIRKNEVGAKPILHIDAAQAPGHIPIRADKLGVDLMTFSSQKFHGPKGTGFLFKKRSVKIEPQITGGDQESGLRGGTENLPGIMGMTLALEIADKDWEVNYAKLHSLQTYFIDKVLEEIPEVKLNGGREQRLPGNVNFSFDGILGEQMVIELDAKGVSVSTGSACTTDKAGLSHVIIAVTDDTVRAEESVRFSFGKDTTERDLDYVIGVIKEVINKQKQI